MTCPRKKYIQADKEWEKHRKSCNVCVNCYENDKTCEAGNALWETSEDAWMEQNKLGCNSMMCPRGFLDLEGCNGR